MKILILKTSALGDILHAFYALSFLKKALPHAQVDWMVEKPFAPLLKAHPHLHKIWTLESKKWRKQAFHLATFSEIWALKKALGQVEYDLIIDLQGNIKSACCLFLARSKQKVGFSLAYAAEWPNTLFTHRRYTPEKGKNVRQDYLFLVQKALKLPVKPFSPDPLFLKLNGQEKLLIEQIQATENSQKLLVALGSNWENKQVKPRDMATWIQENIQLEKPFFFLIYGNEKEKQQAKAFLAHLPFDGQLLKPLSLPALQNFMAKMQLVIAMDSMPLHLAALSNTPTLSFFGPSLAKKYRPMGAEHRALQGPCPYGMNFEKRCKKLRTCPTGLCIKDTRAYVWQD